MLEITCIIWPKNSVSFRPEKLAKEPANRDPKIIPQ
jgi:hypothetical protein